MLENLHAILALDVIALGGIAITALTIWKKHVSPLIKRNTEREKWELTVTRDLSGLAKAQAASAESVSERLSASASGANDRLSKEIRRVDDKLSKHETADNKLLDKLDAMNKQLHEVHICVARLQTIADIQVGVAAKAEK